MTGRPAIKEPFYQPLLESLSKGVKDIKITGAAGSFPSFLLSNLKKAMGEPFLIVTPLPEDAERIAEDLSFFLPGLVHLFPSLSTHPLLM